MIACGARHHPTNTSVVACGLAYGHTGNHWSSTGCAGSELTWASDHTHRERRAMVDRHRSEREQLQRKHAAERDALEATLATPPTPVPCPYETGQPAPPPKEAP